MISDLSSSTEREPLSVLTDSQISGDGDIPACKKPKKSALDILLGPEETSESFTIDDKIDMYLQLKVAVKRLRAPHNMKPSNKLRNSNVF